MTHAIQLKILDSRIGDTIPLPAYATHGSAGLDLRVCINEPIQIALKKQYYCLPGYRFILPILSLRPLFYLVRA